MSQSDGQAEKREPEYPHWNRIYLLVIVYSLVLILGLWLFSRQFD